MKRRLTALLAMAVVLVAGLAAIRWTPKTALPELSPSAPPEKAPVTLASLGDGSDAWWEEVEEELADFCQARGWAYTAYDCRGSALIQADQAAQLAREESADLAVVYAADGSDAAQWVETLEKSGWRVAAVGPKVEGAAWSAGYDETGLAAAAAEFFRGAQGVILLPDVAGDPRLEAVQTVFAQEGVPALEAGSTWGDVDFGRDYLVGALERYPQADGVVAFSRTGVLAGAEALEGREDVKILCLTCSDALKEEIDDGRLAGALEPSASQAAETLKEALPQLAEGKRPAGIELKIETVK